MSVTGTGTRTDPYVITTYADFQNLTQNVTSEPYIKLANAIDLNYTSWTKMWTRGNRPNAHVDMNGYGFYNVVVHGTNLVTQTTESHLFCCAEFYNGTIDVHSSPTDTLPTEDMSYYQMQLQSFQGNLTDTDTTFTKVKFTGMLNVGLTLYHTDGDPYTYKIKYYISMFRGMFNYCTFDMDINLSSSRYAYDVTTRDYELMPGEQTLFEPTMCQTIYNIYKYYINDYFFREDDLDFDMANCDINLRLKHLGCVCVYEGSDYSPVYMFKRRYSTGITIQNCRIRGSLECANMINLKGFLYKCRGDSGRLGDRKIYNTVVNFDFRRCSAPPITISFDGWDLIDTPDHESGTPELYLNNVINADYLRYRRLHGAVTCRNFTNCTTAEITNGNILRTKGFPVVNL